MCCSNEGNQTNLIKRDCTGCYLNEKDSPAKEVAVGWWLKDVVVAGWGWLEGAGVVGGRRAVVGGGSRLEGVGIGGCWCVEVVGLGWGLHTRHHSMHPFFYSICISEPSYACTHMHTHIHAAQTHTIWLYNTAIADGGERDGESRERSR